MKVTTWMFIVRDTEFLFFGNTFGFSRIAVVGAKLALFIFHMKEKIRALNSSNIKFSDRMVSPRNPLE